MTIHSRLLHHRYCSMLALGPRVNYRPSWESNYGVWQEVSSSSGTQEKTEEEPSCLSRRPASLKPSERDISGQNQCNLWREQRWSSSSRVLHLKQLNLLLRDSQESGLKFSVCGDQICFRPLRNQLNDEDTFIQSYSDKLLPQACWGNVENLVNKDRKLAWFSCRTFCRQWVACSKTVDRLPQVGSEITQDCFSICIKIYVGPGLLVREDWLRVRTRYLRTGE